MDQTEVNLALLNGLSKENQVLRQQFRNAYEVLAALCLDAQTPLHVDRFTLLRAADATLTVEHTIEGDMLISAKRGK